MYCINPNDDEPIFLLDCQVGKDEARPDDKYIDGKDFARELMYMDGEGKKRMWVYINSPGGDVSHGEDIQGAILLSKTKVNTLCYGEAASIAGVIFQSGYKRVMLESARLMYHEAYMEGDVSAGDVKSLKVINEAIAKMISSRSWKDVDGVKRMMAQTTYINAEDALASDLCDEIRYNGELNAPKTTDSRARWEYANKILNKVLPIKNDTMSKEVNKILGLNDEASESAKAEAIKAILNKKSEDETELEKTKKALAKAEDEVAKAKAKADEDAAAAKAKADEEAKAKKDMEESEKKAKAKAKILETAKNRGIILTDKAIERYVNLAGSDDDSLASVVETIEETPVVKKAPIVNLGVPDKDAAFVVDATGGVVDTEKMVAHMNKTVLNKSKTRFS